MKNRILIITLSCMCLFCAFLNAQNLPQYTVNKINSPITIDGVLDDDEWLLADTTTHFVVLDTAFIEPSTITWAKVLWDDDYLYVAFYCQDTNVWATITDRDGPLYTEDAVEVYLDPDADGQKYLEFELNPLDAVFDLWITKPWDEGGSGHSEFNFSDFSATSNIIGTVAEVNDVDSAWTCEIALPFSEMTDIAGGGFGFPLPDDVWNFNLYRFDRNSSNDPEAQQTGWSQTGGGQHVPEKFGSILFTENDTTPNALIDNLLTNNDLMLLQNFPNPFSSYTTIKYRTANPGLFTLSIMDISGRIVFTTRMNHAYTGEYTYNYSSNGLSAGTYFYRLQNEYGISTVRKMVIAK